MTTFTFEALGTGWHIDIDDNTVSSALQPEIERLTYEFGQQQSRFIMTSEANAFRQRSAGTYSVSPTLSLLLRESQKIRRLTNGRFDPAVATLLEMVGYDAQYRLSQAPDQSAVTWRIPRWSIQDTQLTIDGPVVFDIGGIGKGYWIDQLSDFLTARGFPYHLVEGGGDMKATTKKEGSGWQIAIEWPGKTDTAIGQVELKNQGFAASDTYRRRWKEWHHIIDARKRKPVDQLVGAVAVAPTAFQADQATSAFFFSQESSYPFIAQQLSSQYLLVNHDHSVSVSKDWSGVLFT